MTLKYRVILICVVIACAALAIFSKYPQIVQHQRNTYRTRGQCRAVLRSHYIAITVYADEHNGDCPPSLFDLLPLYMMSIEQEVHYCLSARSVGRIGRYIYFRPKDKLADLTTDTPLMADYPDNHEGTGTVLYANGHTEVIKDFHNWIQEHLPPDGKLLDNNLKWYQWKPSEP